MSGEQKNTIDKNGHPSNIPVALKNTEKNFFYQSVTIKPAIIFYDSKIDDFNRNVNTA